MRMNWRFVALPAVALLTVCGAGARAPEHAGVGPDLEPLRAQFNAEAGKVRAVFLTAPT